MSDLIKLNTNESPYPPAPSVLDAIEKAASDLRLYPEPGSDQLRACLADYHGVGSEQVFVGNGSDEVLAHAFRAFFQQAEPLLYPDISYSFYPVYAGLFGIRTSPVPLNDEFEIDPADYAVPAGGVVFPNPNAPTGRLLPLSAVRQIAQQNRTCAVLVDEAYIDFGGESAVSLVHEFDHVLVVRTFSKSRALAGLRVGYAVGSPALIDGLTRVKDSFNSYPLDRLAQAAAKASVLDNDYFTATCDRVIANRTRLVSDLAELGFETLPSAANFVLTRHKTADASALADELRARHILVRHFNAARIRDHLRISVGSEEECARLISALRLILDSVS